MDSQKVVQAIDDVIFIAGQLEAAARDSTFALSGELCVILTRDGAFEFASKLHKAGSTLLSEFAKPDKHIHSVGGANG